MGSSLPCPRTRDPPLSPPSALAEIGPSGVRALPLAAGINEGGHYFAYIFPLVIFFFFLLPPLFKTTEGVVVGFQIFACGPELPIE